MPGAYSLTQRKNPNFLLEDSSTIKRKKQIDIELHCRPSLTQPSNLPISVSYVERVEVSWACLEDFSVFNLLFFLTFYQF